MAKFDCEEELLINFSDLELDDVETEAKDREYWIEKGRQKGIELADDCLHILNEIDPEISLNYNQSYIGISHKKKKNNFVIFLPKQNFLRAHVMVNDTEKWANELSTNKFKNISIGKRGRLKFRIDKSNIASNSQTIKEIFKESYESWMS